MTRSAGPLLVLVLGFLGSLGLRAENGTPKLAYATVLAALGAFAALVTECTIEVEKVEKS